jgi:hypothetical protein
MLIYVQLFSNSITYFSLFLKTGAYQGMISNYLVLGIFNHSFKVYFKIKEKRRQFRSLLKVMDQKLSSVEPFGGKTKIPSVG